MVSKINAAAKLRTLLLFAEYKNYKKVAEILLEEDGVEITGQAVAGRIRALNIKPNYDPQHFAAVVARLEVEVAAEKAAGIKLPSRSSEADPLTLEQKIETLLAFVDTKTYSGTAKRLGLDGNTVKDRLIGILGENKTHPVEARKVLKRLMG